MSLYKAFKTSPKLETEGVTFELYGNRITMARAGAGNPDFATAMTKKTQPYRRQIAQGSMDPKEELRLLREVYAETVILNWETKVGDEWKQGIETETGGVIPFTQENVIKTLSALPELFIELQGLASNAAQYRAEELKDDAGNSSSS